MIASIPRLPLAHTLFLTMIDGISDQWYSHAYALTNLQIQFLKKFLLAGVLAFCNPGSVSQLWFGLMLAFIFVVLPRQCLTKHGRQVLRH